MLMKKESRGAETSRRRPGLVRMNERKRIRSVYANRAKRAEGKNKPERIGTGKHG